MNRYLAVVATLLLVPLTVSAADQPTGMILIADHSARAVIVTGETAAEVAQAAARDLQWHIERATGVRLPIITSDQIDALAPDTMRIIVGGGALAEKCGVRAKELRDEEYTIKTSGKMLVIAGKDAEAIVRPKPGVTNPSPGTHLALAHFLDHHLGVRWLWPGEAGTYVPKRSSLVIPPLDVVARPDLFERSFLIPLPRYREENGPSEEVFDRMLQETTSWSTHHQLGVRGELRFGHAFTGWWAKYHATHPDYFAVPPPGTAQMSTKAVKLCTSNPAVVAQIVGEWKEAGMPDVWNVCPNDGVGFCTCSRCGALDAGGPFKAEEVWSGKADLSARHVAFYNAILPVMRGLNPRIMLCSYAYSSYRNPPAGMKIEKGLALEFVHGYDARQAWLEWSAAGVRLALRPNWLHSGAIAPYLPMRAIGGFMRFARSNGMLMYRFDSLHGYWATQGPNYYLIARFAARPELTVEEIVAEYASAFGAAAPAIHQWLDYWQDYSETLAITLAAGGEVSINRDGLYETTCRAHGYPTHPLLGSWPVLPHLYNDDVLSKGERYLDDAERLAASDVEVQTRITFLRDGLKHLQSTRDLIALANSAKPDAAELARRTRELQALRNDLSARHVVWGDVVTGIMSKRGVKPFAKGKGPVDVKGQ